MNSLVRILTAALLYCWKLAGREYRDARHVTSRRKESSNVLFLSYRAPLVTIATTSNRSRWREVLSPPHKHLMCSGFLHWSVCLESRCVSWCVSVRSECESMAGYTSISQRVNKYKPQYEKGTKQNHSLSLAEAWIVESAVPPQPQVSSV